MAYYRNIYVPVSVRKSDEVRVSLATITTQHVRFSERYRDAQQNLNHLSWLLRYSALFHPVKTSLRRSTVWRHFGVFGAQTVFWLPNMPVSLTAWLKGRVSTQ